MREPGFSLASNILPSQGIQQTEEETISAYVAQCCYTAQYYICIYTTTTIPICPTNFVNTEHVLMFKKADITNNNCVLFGLPVRSPLKTNPTLSTKLIRQQKKRKQKNFKVSVFASP